MNDRSYHFTHWFLENWSRASLIASVLLLAVSPFLFKGLTFPLFLVFLQLPVYMIHQYEEHARGAFRAFVNHMVGHDHDALTNAAILWINVPGVWGVDLFVLYFSVYISPALGLIAAYLTVVNALLHIVVGIAMRRYNPGLWTSIGPFLPIGGYTLFTLSRLPSATLGMHALGLGMAIIEHVFIIVFIQVRLAHLKRAIASA